MSIPPAPRTLRQVSPTVVTSHHTAHGGQVSATASITEGDFASPADAPVFMVMTPEGVGGGGKWNGKWKGRCEIQAWAADEVSALLALFDTLDELQLPQCPIALEVAAELAAAPAVVGAGTRESNGTREEWDRRPMGARGPCPRRHRYKWRAEPGGATIRIYGDTLKRHADPNCQCPHCAAPPTPDEDEDENE